MAKYKMTLSYDGTDFGGWQIQPKRATIQETLQQAFHTLLKKQVFVTGSGRTDAGVHASGQVAHFSIEEALEPNFLIAALNGNLPHAIRIKSIEKAPETFHARYSAKKKIYHYHLHLDPVSCPFRRRFTHHVRYPFNQALLEEALPLFCGTHDFTAFANEANTGAAANDPVKTLYSIEAISQEGGLRLEFEGSGFLYKMVRNIVGTLLEVAREKISLDAIPELFAKRDRRLTPPPAPAQGLFLMQVDYPE